MFAQSGNASAALFIETQPPRFAGSRGAPWQIGHDWQDGVDQRTVIEQLGKQREIRVSVLHKDVPHGRFLDIEFADGRTATIVLDQGFGAWGPPRSVVVRHDFNADHATQAKRLASVNAVLQRRRVGKTYVVASPGKL
ncbi:hypothetical protein [Rhodoplanes sp. SY1]|uniref:hypothetical protein n=1 Tax=Rhodoplanes sp. SY1 TaxID=3166646 RepID=UPI0038B4EC8C